MRRLSLRRVLRPNDESSPNKRQPLAARRRLVGVAAHARRLCDTFLKPSDT